MFDVNNDIILVCNSYVFNYDIQHISIVSKIELSFYFY